MGYDGSVEVGNDPSIELGWLSEATTFADNYLARLQDPTVQDPLAGLPGVGDAAVHDTIYKAFRRVFPTLDVARLNPEDPLGPYLDREFWTPLLRRHGHLIPDPTMLTLLRTDAGDAHHAGNAMLVPRLKFLCIEVARNREGLNKAVATVAVKSESCHGHDNDPSSSQHGAGNGAKAASVVVMRRTRRFSAIGVAAAAASAAAGGAKGGKPKAGVTVDGAAAAAAAAAAEEEGEDVEELVQALMEANGAGADASDEVRALVREEIKRQLEGYRQAGLANRAGVAEQARQARPPAAYKPDRPLLSPNHVATIRGSGSGGDGGLVVLDQVISQETLAKARAEAEAMKARGKLKPTPQKAAGTRFDSIRWLSEEELLAETEAGDGAEGETAYPTLVSLVRTMKGLAWEVEQGKGQDADGSSSSSSSSALPDLVVPLHCMIAVYEGEGALYVPHRDNTPRAMLARNEADGVMGNDREVTAILYLNPPDWDAQRDGGCLRCYLGAAPDDEDGSTATEVRDVSPEGGRLVMFRSRDLLHEVRTTHESGKHKAVRWALSIWILGKAPGASQGEADPIFVVG